MAKLISTNPGRGYETVGEVEISTDDEIKQTVAKANSTNLIWKETSVKDRINILKPVLAELTKKAEEIAELQTKEMGKPIRQSTSGVKSYLNGFQWMLDNVESAIKDEQTSESSRIVYEPWGTVAVITPWNFPLGMAIWGIVPNLLVGNTVVFKISEECPLIGKIVEDIFTKHLPPGVFSVVHGAGDVGEKLARNNVDFIWFTGSTKVGQKLYRIAADKFIKVLLELGGSNPCIVFDDANIDEYAELLYQERFFNNGQVCDALKRLIVHQDVFDDVVRVLKTKLLLKVVGDPMDSKTDLSCLVAKRQVDLLDSQVRDAISKGAEVVVGGKISDLDGAYYEPTILTNISRDMRVWTEEVFGPVLPVIPFKTEEEAVDLANDTIYGLGSRVITKDSKRAERIAARINAGSVEINHGSRWSHLNPFGGYKFSGMGREHGLIGFRELCQIKVIAK